MVNSENALVNDILTFLLTVPEYTDLTHLLKTVSINVERAGLTLGYKLAAINEVIQRHHGARYVITMRIQAEVLN